MLKKSTASLKALTWILTMNLIIWMLKIIHILSLKTKCYNLSFKNKMLHLEFKNKMLQHELFYTLVKQNATTWVLRILFNIMSLKNYSTP